MAKEIAKTTGSHASPFERIRKVNEAGNEYWESRDLAEVLDYTQYRNFEAVIEKAKLACFNSGHRIDDHFADVSKMIEIGSGATREIKVALLSRYANTKRNRYWAQMYANQKNLLASIRVHSRLIAGEVTNGTA